MRIRVIRGSLAEVRAEAILRPVNAELQAVSAAGREVELRAGGSVRRRLDALGELPPGAAVVTPGGGLEIPFLIHVVTQSRDEPPTEAALRLALVNGLRRAAEWELTSLALPPLGAGVGQMVAEEAASALVALLMEHAARSPHPAEVTLVAAGAYEVEVLEGALAAAGSAGARATGGEG